MEPALAAERCRQAAEKLEEPVPLAVADWARAHVAAGTGSYRRALTLTNRAASELERHMSAPAAPEVLGMLHLTASVAVLADRSTDAARAHVGEADRLASKTGETTCWSMLFGPANVGVWRMSMEIDAGEPGRAVEASERVDTAKLSIARRASFHVELARALTDIKRDDQAVQHLLVAERTAPQLVHASVPAREAGRFLLNRSRRLAGGSALRGLCERLGVAG